MLRSAAKGYAEAFHGLPKQVWVLAACLLVNRMGTMVLPFLELYLTGARGYDVEAAGRLVALYGLGSILGVGLGGWLTDRLGPWRVQMASLVGSGIGLLLLWRARSPLAIGLAAMGTSLAGDAFRPANGAAITAAASPQTRSRAFSLMSLAINLGLSVGLPIAGALAKIDFDWLFWIDASTAFAAAVLLGTLAPRDRPPAQAAPTSAAPPRASPWRDRGFLGVSALQCLSAVVLFQFFGALPVFLKHDLGFDEGGVGGALALNTIVTALFGMPIVRMVERRGEVSLLGVGSSLMCVGYGLNAFATGPGTLGTSVALTSIVVWSLGETLFFPLGASFVSKRADGASVGRYLGVYHMALSLALVISPWVGTLIYQRAGPRWLWIACAAVALPTYFGMRTLSSARPRA